MRSLFLWVTLAFIAAFLGTCLLIWLESSRYFVSLGFWTLQMVMGSAVALAACSLAPGNPRRHSSIEKLVAKARVSRGLQRRSRRALFRLRSKRRPT